MMVQNILPAFRRLGGSGGIREFKVSMRIQQEPVTHRARLMLASAGSFISLATFNLRRIVSEEGQPGVTGVTNSEIVSQTLVAALRQALAEKHW